MKFINEKGAVVLLYVSLVAVIVTLLLVAVQSRSMLSTKRNIASADSLLANYDAESEVNDFLAKLVGGFISTSDLKHGISFDKNVSGTNIHIEANTVVSGKNETQTVTATAKRAYAVSKIEGIREINTTEDTPKDVEIALILDCTSSMNNTANPLDPSKGSRFKQERIAAADSFIQKIIDLPNNNKYHLGVGIFGTNAKWIDTSWVTGKTGVVLSPDNTMSLADIKSIINAGITDTRNGGICKEVNDYTSIGSGYALANKYYATDTTGYKKVTVLITDGEPNTREQDSDCPPSLFCQGCVDDAKKYMRCQLADTDTYINENGYKGKRMKDVDTYGITIYSGVSASVVQIFTKYSVPNGYFGLNNATELPTKLNEVLDTIVNSNSTFSIHRIIPQ
jgi:hypothetical protein